MINLFNCDCMGFMRDKPDKFYDLAIVDPPYGISINENMGLKKGVKKRHNVKKWDKVGPDDIYFDELFRISKNQIIWGGGQYFWLPPTYHYISWYKMHPEGLSFSDCEMAWTSFNKANRIYKERSSYDGKIHPTQKPVQLYEWLLMRYAKTGDKILDTHGGSGSICIACHNLGFDLDWMELDTEYFDAAKKRYEIHIAQQRLF